MLEEIIGSVCRFSNEKIKITKGMAVAAALGAFIIGLISGVIAARLALSKKFAACCSSSDDFDADEYVKNLNFSDDE